MLTGAESALGTNEFKKNLLTASTRHPAVSVEKKDNANSASFKLA
jgi:hypothetical protein